MEHALRPLAGELRQSPLDALRRACGEGRARQAQDPGERVRSRDLRHHHAARRRQRREDVALLATYFVARFARQFGKRIDGIAPATLDELTPGDVVIKAEYSSVNYKDALAATGAGKILRRFPVIGGIDVAGIVAASGDARFREVDEVLVTGYDLGVANDGGYSEYVRVPADWVVPLPRGLSLFEAMAIGTAGYTAGLAICLLEQNDMSPGNGKVLVNGATGGVATLAIDRSPMLSDSVPATAAAGAGRYLGEALAVLQAGGRIGAGGTVVVADRLIGTRSVVVPPADPAAIGALNRALAARGVSWRFGDLVAGEWMVHGEVGAAAGSTVRRRYRLETGAPSASTAVVARANDDPWVVRDRDVVLIGSRLEEDWTDLPVSAGFVPFVDLLLNRVAAGETQGLRAHPGDVIEVPPGVDAVLSAAGPEPVAGLRRVTAPREPGVFFLRGAGGDKVGALEVNHDPRESRLAPADARVLRAALGSTAELVTDGGLGRELFGGARRADLSGALLLVALLCAAAEFLVSSVGARVGRGRV